MKISRTNMNIIYLYTLRIAMYIFPLITLPLLVQTLGISNYGVISVIQSVTNYFVLLINYGFNFSATRDVAKKSGDKKSLDKIFTSTFFTKIILLIISVPIIIFIGTAIPLLRNNFGAYLMIFLMLANEIFFPIYFFQGMEDMKIVTIINLFTRFVGLILLILFVTRKDDLVIAIFITNVSSLMGGVFGFFYAKKIYHINLVKIHFKDIVREFKEGWDFFLAQGMSTMLSNSNTLILGIFLTSEQVGYYSVAEKIMRMAASFVSPFSNAIYPVAIKKFEQSLNDGINFLKKYFFMGSLIFGIGSTMLFFLAPYATILINGTYNVIMINNLRIIAFIPLSIFVNNIYGTQIQLQINRKKQFRNLIILCGSILPVLTIILINIIPQYCAAVSLLISELLLTISMLVDVEFITKKGFLKQEHI